MKKICVIDDDLVTAKIYQDSLEAEGFKVEVIGDGQKALEILKTSRPDLVLLDLMLPKVHGIEVLKFIRAQPATASLPVIVFTNAYLTSMVKAAWNAGANMTLTKANSPPDKLVQAIRTALSAAPTTTSVPTFAPPPAPVAPAARPPAPSSPAPAPPTPPQSTPPATPLAAAPVSQPEISKPAPTPAPPPIPVKASLPPAPAPETKSISLPEPEPVPEVVAVPEPVQPEEEVPAENSSVSPATPEPPPPAPAPESETPSPTPDMEKSSINAGDAPPAASPSAPAATAPTASTPSPTVRRPARLPGSAGATGAKGPTVMPVTVSPNPLPPAVLNAGLSAAQSLHAEIRQKFLDNAPATAAALRKWLPGSAKNKKQFDWATLLYELHRIVRPLPGHAGIAKFDTIAQICSALEALLEALFEEPEHMNASSFRTVVHAAELLAVFFEQPVDSQNQTSSNANLLVVDDEATSRQLIRSALELANLKCISLDDPGVALRLLQENYFDLIFTDVEMPQMNGFEFCAQVRTIPACVEVPVVFITSLSDFDSRARSTISGGNDLIAKPFLLIELSVKALTYVFKSQLHTLQEKSVRF